MSRNWSYTSGQHNAICDSCGRKFKSAELRKRWDGFMVCEDDWEPRQTLDFVRSRADKQTPPWIRPQLPMVFNHVLGIYEDLPITESVRRVATYYRNPYDTVLIIESDNKGLTKSLSDEVNLHDSDYFEDEYIEASGSYMLQYLSYMRGYDTPDEQIGLVETGVINVQSYIDITYFGGDYVGTNYTF